MSLTIYFYPPFGSTWDHSQNVTHNLRPLAEQGGLAKPLWYPEEANIRTAAELIPHLQTGLQQLVVDPVRLRAMNPENGWGSYDEFIPWLIALLTYCIEHPQSRITVSR